MMSTLCQGRIFVEPKKKSFRGDALPANTVVIYPSAGSSRLNTHPYYHVQYSLHSSYSELMECLETVCASVQFVLIRMVRPLGCIMQFLPDVVVPTSRRDTASIHKLQVALAELHDAFSSASMISSPGSDACPDAAVLLTQRPAGRMPAALFEHALTRAEHHRVIRRIARAGAPMVSCKWSIVMLCISLCVYVRPHAIAALSSVPEYLQRKKSRPLLDSPPVGQGVEPSMNVTTQAARTDSTAEEDDGAFDELLNCLQDSSDGSECSDADVFTPVPSRVPVPIIQQPAVNEVSASTAVARPVISGITSLASARARPASSGKVVQKRRRSVPSTLSTLKLLASWADE